MNTIIDDKSGKENAAKANVAMGKSSSSKNKNVEKMKTRRKKSPKEGEGY